MSRPDRSRSGCRCGVVNAVSTGRWGSDFWVVPEHEDDHEHSPYEHESQQRCVNNHDQQRLEDVEVEVHVGRLLRIADGSSARGDA
jgi:hypothetical protein